MITVLEATARGVGESISAFFASVTNSFIGFKITDAIDIIVLAVILFLAFRFLKGRKAGAVIIGVVLVFLITFIAFATGLQATHSIFSAILDIGVLAIVIIFQPEIRDALEKIGTGSMSGIMILGDQKKKREAYTKAIEEICAAVAHLSEQKTGALIIIARTTTLDEIIATGITINADVNAFLLRNLFFNKAPLHDGAVIIDEGRIVAAGCLLPLTRRTDVDGDLGTRHRAAIGISETSDAIAVVVSEETGTISVAYDCTLTRNYTSETLKRYLMRKMIKQNSKESSDNRKV